MPGHLGWQSPGEDHTSGTAGESQWFVSGEENHDKDTYPKNWPEECIRDTELSEQESFILLSQARETLLRSLPRLVPNLQQPFNLLPRDIGNRHDPRIPGDEVGAESISNRGEA